MKKQPRWSYLLLGIALPALAANLQDKGPEQHLLYPPEQIEWQPGPASVPAGAQFAVLEGNPAEAGIFTLRLKMPDGYQIPLHWHPGVERVTVVSGTFYLGMDDSLAKENAHRLETGSYTAMPPGMRHYALAEGETVVQLTSVGPWQLHYVNPADDPRQ
ncbi:cupin domain-containing protein [Zobellella iuensis]|uniref:Cupin domain-containing protein n=1 Tax=Zobellella iuensis TaxID=2803811 RepID=A0ABS1QW54_9GAMM|nr:cupin domain-containing protein [Zobellella iuensis]MBL1379092.1 cupin domain-containing protein [Zobellella iuensis]